MVFSKKKKKKEGIKEQILNYIEKNKEQLGEDYQNIKEKVSDFKDDMMSKEEIKQVEEWIKKHPFLSIAFALILGGTIHKIFSKGD